jgi:hypothetical protein
VKHISSYLQNSRLKQQNSVDWLHSLWLRAAPESLQQVCKPVRYTDNCLTLSVDSPIWLSRLRQQHKTLLRQLRRSREFSSLREIRLQVDPRQVKPKRRKRTANPRSIPANSAELLRSTADHVGNPELGQALIRLANTAARLRKPDQ